MREERKKLTKGKIVLKEIATNKELRMSLKLIF